MLDENQYYKIIRLAVISFFCNEKLLDINNLSRGEFNNCMSFIKKIYIDHAKYRDLCISGKVSDKDV